MEMERIEQLDDEREGILRVEVDAGEELCMRLFVPHPEKREIEFYFRSDVAERLLRSFSRGIIPDYLIDIFENSKVCLFSQGCMQLFWNNRVVMLRPSTHTLFAEAQFIGESYPHIECAAVSEYWKYVASVMSKVQTPKEEENRLFLSQDSWKLRNSKAKKNRYHPLISRIGVIASIRKRKKQIEKSSPSEAESYRLRRKAPEVYPGGPSTSETETSSFMTPLDIAERRWKEKEKINDKRFDGVLFKNVPEGQDGVSNWEVKLFKDAGYNCWGQMSMTGEFGLYETPEFSVGTEPHLSSFLSHLVALFASRNINPTLADRLTDPEML